MLNFMIGVGGTGSKCVESFIHLCACGLGPKSVWTGLIEMDRSNGNLDSCLETISGYKAMFEMAKPESAGDITGKPFGSRLDVPGEQLYWSPINNMNSTFSEYYYYPTLKGTPAQMFMDSIYTAQERDIPLEMGFRGRPSIGAPVFLGVGEGEGVDTTDGFWNTLFQANQADESREIRIMLVGSIFGGTGASGIPNLAKIIRTKFKDRKVSIGATLMLPYFDYGIPNKDHRKEVHAQPQNFSANSQATLEYYHSFFSRNNTFDSVYLLGWDPRFTVYNDPNVNPHGGEGQNNPAFMPELLAAVSGSHFFMNSSEEQGFKVKIPAAASLEEFSWNDIPLITPAHESNRIKFAMGSMARFAFAYLAIYHPFFNSFYESGNSRKWQQNANLQPWFSRLVSESGIDLQANSEAPIVLRNYCEKYLLWLGSLARTSPRSKLLSTHCFADVTEDLGVADAWKKLNLLDEQDFKLEGFESLIQEAHGSSLDAVFKNLNEIKTPRGYKSFGIFVRALLEVTGVG